MRHSFFTIYWYEIRKLTGKRLFSVMAVLCALCIAITSFAGIIGTYYVDGEPVESHYEAFKKDQAYRKALSGRLVDQILIRETLDGYARVPADTPRYTLTEEYETFARPYSDIFNLIRVWTGMDLASLQAWDADEAALYEARSERLETLWQSIPLTEGEKVFWRHMESQIDTPLRYVYHEGYENILSCYLTVGMLMLLFVAICLSNLFPDERIRRTDQLVLSSIDGRETVYWAKIFAGVTVSVAAATLMSLMTMCLNLAFYGAEGFSMPVQVSFLTYSYPITIGQACMIAYSILIITSVLAAVFVMFISELSGSGIVSLSVSACLIILGNVIVIPTQYRAAAQIWDWLPMAYLSTWNVFDARMLTLFGRSFVSWQIVPFLYILLSAILATVGKCIYQQRQISGR